jgi:hypothetical protein
VRAKPPADPRVRRFLDLLAEAVAADLLREIKADESASDSAAEDEAHTVCAEAPEPQQRAG